VPVRAWRCARAAALNISIGFVYVVVGFVYVVVSFGVRATGRV
jgi:hypothetical protein